MYIQIIDNTARNNEPSFRQVTSLSYWKNNVLVKTAPTKQQVEEFLSCCQSGKQPNNIIITSSCQMYYTPDTPGYCDGEKTTLVNYVIDAMETIVENCEQITAENMKEVINSNNIAMFNDPGHGWLRVPLSLIRYLKINRLISGYSYRDAQNAYLEEDCDMTVFLNAIGLAYSPETKDLLRSFFQQVPDRHTNGQSPIRSYPRYEWEAMQRRFEQSSLGSLDKVVHALAKG